MSTTWKKVVASEVKPGDRIKRGDTELTVSRIDSSFMSRPEMIAFVEDTPERWLKLPSPTNAELEIRVES